MNLFLTLAFLFFIGSVFGWVLELFFRLCIWLGSGTVFSEILFQLKPGT